MFNFRKIASVLASTVMVGSTVALAAAAFPAPFVQGGSASVAEVYGSNPAAAVDLAAIVEINSKLQTELAKQTATAGSSTSASATGGDSVNIASSSQKLYANSALNLARSVITKTEMPALLADGTAYDNSGTAYDYRQQINLGGTTLTFDKSGESIDPIPYVNIGTTSGNFFNYTLTLTKILNVSDSTVIGNAEFNILGQKFTVGANSDSNTLYLYGSGTPLTITGGEEQKVTVDSNEHTIKLITTSSSTAGTLEVDGVRKSVTKGNSYKFAGAFEVYIKDITSPVVAGDPRDMQVLVGARTIHFESGDTVKFGAEDTSLENTKATITGTAGQGITKLVLEQAKEDSTGDYVSAGQAYTDRVFGSLKVQFAGLNPALDSASRDKVVVEANELGSKVTFTSALAGTVGEKTIQYALDNDNTADTTLNRVNLTYQLGSKFVVEEGKRAKINDYVIVNSGDKGRILKVSSIPSNTTSSNKVAYIDVITGEKFEFSTGIGQSASNNIDGQTYYVNTSNVEGTTSDNRNVSIYWGAGASVALPGTYTTLFPRIQLKNGEWLAFLESTSVTTTNLYALPGEYLLSDYEAGANLTLAADGTNKSTTKIGAVNFTITGVDPTTNATGTLTALDVNSDGTVDCNFNNTFGPSILLYEEKTLASSNGNAICIPLTTEGTNPLTPAVAASVFTDGVGSFKQLSTDTDKYQAVDLFGTFLERDTSGQNKVTVMYPDEQMIADVLFTSAGATVSAGTSSSGTVKELGAPFVKDTEVASVSGSNLIVVGGSCVNTVAAKLLDTNDGKICGADFTAKTGVSSGEFLIQTFTSPYSASKVATLVAGYSASDTVNAAKFLTTQTVDTTVGKKYKGTSATTASLVTTA